MSVWYATFGMRARSALRSDIAAGVVGFASLAMHAAPATWKNLKSGACHVDE